MKVNRRVDQRHAGQSVPEKLRGDAARRRNSDGQKYPSVPATCFHACRKGRQLGVAAAGQQSCWAGSQLFGGRPGTEGGRGRPKGLSISLTGHGCRTKSRPWSRLDVVDAPQVVTVNPYEHETKEQRDARLKWWPRGPASACSCTWGVVLRPRRAPYHDKRIGGIGEWIMHDAKIPCAEYRQFGPAVQSGPSSTRTSGPLGSKEAGMKYIVITSKAPRRLRDVRVAGFPDWNIKKAHAVRPAIR